MTTPGQIRSEVVLAVTQSAPTVDLELDDRQILWWATVDLNSLVAVECNSKIAKGEMIPPVYKKRVNLEIPEIDPIASGTTGEPQDRVFIELDDDILNLNRDSGIIRVTTDEGDIVNKTSPDTIDIIRYMEFSKPTIDNLVYYREGKKIFLPGLKDVDVLFSSINVDYVPKQDLTTMADTDEVLVSDLVLPQLIASVVRRAKEEMYGSTPDLVNNGIDPKPQLYHTAIQNPEQ